MTMSTEPPGLLNLRIDVNPVAPPWRLTWFCCRIPQAQKVPDASKVFRKYLYLSKSSPIRFQLGPESSQMGAVEELASRTGNTHHSHHCHKESRWRRTSRKEKGCDSLRTRGLSQAHLPSSPHPGEHCQGHQP